MDSRDFLDVYTAIERQGLFIPKYLRVSQDDMGRSSPVLTKIARADLHFYSGVIVIA